MDEVERRAIGSLRFDWAPRGDDVWLPPVAHVDGLNHAPLDTVLTAFDEAHRGRGSLGVAVIGSHGAGKTHLLSAARAAVQDRGGYFFLVSLLHGKDFWQNIVHAVRGGLFHPATSGTTQLTELLHRLGEVLALPRDTRARMAGDAEPDGGTLDQVAATLRRAVFWGHECRHTLRALVLLASPEPTAQEIAEAYLTSADEGMPGERMKWGIHPRTKPAQEISRIVAQARKYGLGLVFATQAPKGIHNRIVGNAATQFFGFINSPTQVAAAKEMAAARNSTVLDISRLRAGEFYAVTEGTPFRKITAPMCLSHHPQSALTAEDVLTRATG